MYFITKEQMQSEKITASAKLVLAIIALHAQENPEKNLSYITIAKLAGITEVTAMKVVKDLVDEGFISVEKNNRGWNVYQLKS